MYQKIIKPFFDFSCSLLGLIIVSPIFIIVMISLALSNQGKPFFFQERPGKKGKIFKIIKFKSMNDKKDVHGNLLSDAERLTPIGALVRKTSLDEIPQLLNVLKGDMSLIGPRPLLVHYLPLYSEFQSRRHNVKPGITGWAQVNGRNIAKFSKRFEYDVWYVDNLSFKLDVKIFVMTIKKVFKSDGMINGQDIKDVDDLKFNEF
ncbi:sugar transferase [Aequorivita sp. Q41]|uniref:sugar transferase n=1 Tax=Aequorivita sp. Q41 TaxID=3153300 RepID=UPI003242BD6A